ncbi:MAG: prepilin-type N-terminal cleavage/methylation domain-containing protein [Phycisphaerales bacterium]
MSRARAFTLMEVMLALALITLLMLGMITLLWGVSDSRERIMREARRAQALGGVIERLESDLLACIAGDSALGAGVKGDATSLTVLSRGVWLSGPDAARRATPEEIEAGAGAQQPTDLIGARYELIGGGAAAVAPGGAGEGEAGTASDAAEERAARGLRIVRWPAGPGMDGRPGGTPGAIAEDVEEVRFRYFDGSAWRDRFDSLEAAGLPAAIEIAIWARRGGGERGATADRNAPVEDEATGEPRRGAPDRVRVIAIPDGGLSAGGAA